jgi:putative ABC transport system substrate-binding protein
MRRREFITLLGGAAAYALLLPRAGRTQQPARRQLIGFLAGASSTSAFSSTARSFLKGLGEQGFVDGREIDITYRFADGYLERLPRLADELVRLKPDVILAPATPPALAAKRATATIPIVCPLLDNPVGLGLVSSHNRPVGNVGLLVNLASTESVDKRRDTEVAAQKLPIKLVPVEVQSPDDLGGAFGTFASERVQAVVVLQDSMFFSEHRTIIALAAEHRLPAIWSTRIFAEAGGLISYGVDEADSFRRVAGYVGMVLKGAKPSDLPVELPTKFELIINLKAARALGLTVPDKLLALADEVIE